MKLFLVVALLGLAAWYAAKTMPDQRRPLAPLEPLLAAEAQAGWRVARPPELAGPYRREGRPNHVGRGEIGTVAYRGPTGPVIVKLEAKENAEQMAIPLQTSDGSVTVVVLER